jgi:hypothetical protein
MTSWQETVEVPRTADSAQQEHRRKTRATPDSKCWRECMGVEPTQDGPTAPHRF